MLAWKTVTSGRYLVQIFSQLLICERTQLYHQIDTLRSKIDVSDHVPAEPVSANEFLHVVLVIVAAILNPCRPSFIARNR